MSNIKVTKAQLEKARKRIEGGESLRSVARDYGVSPGGLSERLNPNKRVVIKAAKQLVAAEENFSKLNRPEQLAAVQLASQLMAISTNLAGAARHGSMTARHLSWIAAKQTMKVNHENPMESQEELQAISALTKISNDAASVGMNLLKTVNKDPEKESQDDLAAAFSKLIEKLPS